MSTKTTFKRIALVTVAALGFGVLTSVAPASAAVATTAAAPWAVSVSQDPQGGAGTATARTATQIAGALNFVAINATTTSTSTSSVLKVTGSTITVNDTTAGTLNAGNTEIVFAGAVDSSGGGDIVQIATPTAGTVTATWYTRVVTNGVPTDTAAETITFTVSAVKTWSDRYSTATAAGDNVGSGSGVWSSGETIYAPKGNLNAAAVDVATITFDFRDSSNTVLSVPTGAYPSVRAVVRVNGPGNIRFGSEAAIGRDVTLVTTAQAPTLNVYNDGVAGTSTIDIYVGGATTPSYTKSVSFYGAVTSLVAAQGLYVADAAGGSWGCGASSCAATSVATTPAATITATDALGIAVPYLTLTATSSSTTDFSSSVNIAQKSTGAGTYYSDVNVITNGTSGKKASYTWASGTAATSNALTYALGTAMTGVTFTVTPGTGLGAVGTMAVALKDASNNLPFDASYSLALKSNVSLTGSIAPATSTTISQSGATSTYIVLNGAGSWTFFNPLVEGNVSFAGSTFGAVAITAAFDVMNVTGQAALDAAQEATDAANAATDAANAAAEAADAATAAAQDAADAVAALSAQVATMISALKKQLIALTNLVIKIQKKVKA